MTVAQAYNMLYMGALILLLILVGIMLVRSVIGPRILDRLLSINMIGTMVISSIAVLSRMLDESYLADVALIYAMVSLVTMLMMAAMYIPGDQGAEKDAGGNRKKKRKRRRRS